jgi:hypothetical protein
MDMASLLPPLGSSQCRSSPDEGLRRLLQLQVGANRFFSHLTRINLVFSSLKVICCQAFNEFADALQIIDNVILSF